MKGYHVCEFLPINNCNYGPSGIVTEIVVVNIFVTKVTVCILLAVILFFILKSVAKKLIKKMRFCKIHVCNLL